MPTTAPDTDLIARAERLVAEALDGTEDLSMAELPRRWPLTRPVLRAVLGRMQAEGRVRRVIQGDGGGPPRFTTRLP